MDGWQKHRVSPGACVGHDVERNRLIDQRADAVTNVAAQAEEVQAGFMVNQRRQPHVGFGNVGQAVIERAGRAGFNTGNVFAHLARQGARREEGGAGGHRVFRFGQLENMVRTVAHAQAAADAGADKIHFGDRSRRADGQWRQGLGLLRIKPQAEPEHTNPASHFGGVENELATLQ